MFSFSWLETKLDKEARPSWWLPQGEPETAATQVCAKGEIAANPPVVSLRREAAVVSGDGASLDSRKEAILHRGSSMWAFSGGCGQEKQDPGTAEGQGDRQR